MKCPKCQFENPAGAPLCGRCAAPLNPPREREPGFKEIDIVSPNPAPNSPTETLLLPIKELASGSTFAGRYQVIEELGKGGMGSVYKVFDTEVEEKVALKLLKTEIASDEETIKRFRNELKLARAQYEKIIALTTGRIAFGDIYARSFYALGKIWEQQGEKLKAGQNYQKFLDLWKDADAGQAEVAEAKKRLSALDSR